MESIAKGVGSLLTDSKYCDVEIRCGGRTFYKHRAIVCARCEDLEKECEESFKKTGKRIIEHSLFDPATYERFLQFLYTGDYTVDSAQLSIAKRGASPECHANGNGVVYINGNGAVATPPHLRHASPKINGHHESTKYAPATNSMEAHVLVYAIACHYELPELKTIALKKFKDAKQTPLFVNFLALVKMVYGLTQSSDDPLRKEALRTLLNDYRLSLASDHAKNALAHDVELHQLTADITQILAKQEKSGTDAQSTASKLLLSDLERTSDALAKSDASQRALKADVGKLKEEKRTLQAETETLKTENSTLRAEISSVKATTAGAVTEKSKLEAELVNLKTSQKKSTDEIDKLKAELQQKEKQLKDANLWVEALQERCDAFNMSSNASSNKDKTIAQEKARADTNAKSAKDWKAAHDSEKKKADKATEIIRSMVRLVNRTSCCDTCGEDLQFRLQPDNRVSTTIPFNNMLTCCECGQVHYGSYIV